jgi:ABC-type amino acid transport substrate-binding protein
LLNKAIAAVRSDGTYDTLQKKYFTYDIYGE